MFLDVIDINGNHKNSKLADFINSETRIDIYSGYMSRLSDDKIIYFETNGKARRGSFFTYNESLGIMTIK